MKRKGTTTQAPAHSAKKRRRTYTLEEVKEARSTQDEAKPYYLTTVRFPIDALTADWSVGVNREINNAHKRRLYEIFNEVGVLRQDASHQLLLACSKAHVEQMLAHLTRTGEVEAAGGEGAEEAKAAWPSFNDWSSVVGEKAELIAGHHRVEAFKEYLQSRQLPEEERWWVCQIYDKGLFSFPPET